MHAWLFLLQGGEGTASVEGTHTWRVFPIQQLFKKQIKLSMNKNSEAMQTVYMHILLQRSNYYIKRNYVSFCFYKLKNFASLLYHVHISKLLCDVL
jgi:hypothetical protein